MKNTNQKGFTLIELLIVIGIIAILAAAVIIAINPGRQFEQARNATRWSNMNSIANAVYSYVISEGGNFPTCIGDFGEAVNLSTCSDELTPDYMQSIPEDPSGGENYQIEYASDDNNRIKITSTATEADEVEVIQ
jgi:prepilin-type N-terminal cleavage/methylation domain-containing protein